MRSEAFLLLGLLACTTPEKSGASDDAGDASSEDARPLPNPPPIVTPPTISCADAGMSCAMPPSVCADANWLAYFDDGECVDGQCRLITKYYFCDTGCNGGSCK